MKLRQVYFIVLLVASLLPGVVMAEGQQNDELQRIIALAQKAHTCNDYAAACRLYRIAAELGDANSAYTLGELLYYDYIVNKEGDWKKWTKFAADRGHEEANFKYCKRIMTGDGTQAEVFEAESRLESLAKKGRVDAMVLYGDYLRTYETMQEALVWYKKAAAKGDIYGILKSGYFTPDKQEQKRYFDRAMKVNPTVAKEYFVANDVRYKP